MFNLFLLWPFGGHSFCFSYPLSKLSALLCLFWMCKTIKSVTFLKRTQIFPSLEMELHENAGDSKAILRALSQIGNHVGIHLTLKR